MDLEALRRRLGVSAAEAMGVPTTSDDAENLTVGPLIPAAVLVGIVGGPAPGVLLTRRAAHLARHAGQVAFPGGRMDPGDVSAEAAALREAHEEVGLDPAIPELAGRLPEHLTGTGFRITPILAFLPSGLELVPQEDEVASIFILPLSTLLDPTAPQRQRNEFRGRQREFWVWPHPEHYIWGATASILVSLAGRLQHAAAA